MATVPTIQKGTYRHTKTGGLYEVLGVALHTESNEYLVVYRPLKISEYELFTRPYEMFIEKVSINGKSVPRFEKTADASQVL